MAVGGVNVTNRGRSRSEHQARRRRLRHAESARVGVNHPCNGCGQTFDEGCMLNLGDGWLCDVCDLEREADQTLASASASVLPSVGGTVLVLGTLLADLWARGAYSATVDAWTMYSILIVASVSVMVYTWAAGLRRAGIGGWSLGVTQLVSGLVAAAYFFGGIATMLNFLLRQVG